MVKLTMLHTVEERYGEEVAADYLMNAVQFIAQRLHSDDQLFHCSSDVLMAVIRRHSLPGAVRMEVGRLFMETPQHLIQQGGGKTMVTIAFRFDLLPAAQFSTMEDLMAAVKAKNMGII